MKDPYSSICEYDALRSLNREVPEKESLRSSSLNALGRVTGACVQVNRGREYLIPRMKGFVGRNSSPPNAGSLKRGSVKGSPLINRCPKSKEEQNHEVYDHLGQRTRQLQSNACAVC